MYIDNTLKYNKRVYILIKKKKFFYNLNYYLEVKDISRTNIYSNIISSYVNVA